MKTHINKRESDKAKSIANELSQKKTSSASTLQLVDNRTEAIGRRKLHGMPNSYPKARRPASALEMGNPNPRLKQAAQLQPYASGHSARIHLRSRPGKKLQIEAWHTMQQRPAPPKRQLHMPTVVDKNQNAILKKVMQAKLKSDALNLAGETHDEYEKKGNEGLRDKEKIMAEKKAGGGYWSESEFKVSEDDWWYGKKKGESGDPILYQFLQVVELVDSIGGRHIGSMDPAKQEQAKYLRELVENCIRTLGGGVVERYKNLSGEVKSGLVKLTDDQSDAAQKIGLKLHEMNGKCSEIYAGIDVNGVLLIGVDAIGKLQADCSNLNGEIKKLGAVLNKKKPMTQANIRVPRSKEMHFSAQASHKTKGVWKVGNNHYMDINNYIKGTFVSAPKYNLLSKAEFNDERDKFDPDK